MKTKNIVITIIAVGLIVGAVFLLNKTPQVSNFDVSTLFSKDAIADLYNNANVLEVMQGSATITHSNETTEEVSLRIDVVEGDTIKINPDSLAIINWFDGSISRLQAGTELTIQKADYNPNNISEINIGFNISEGEVWSKVISLVDENSKFLSYGNNVVAGVRGSAYNMTVKNNEVNVESLEHAAFVAKINKETQKIIKDTEAIVLSGEEVSVNDSVDKIIPEDIPEEKLTRDWIKNNENRDKKAEEQIQKRNLERIKRLAGPLPGETDYKAKEKAIQKYLESIKDPTKLAKAKVRVAQIRVNEAIATAITKGGVDVAKRIKAAQTQIAESNLSDDAKAKLTGNLQDEVRVLNRALDPILPDNEALYNVKEVLRQQRVELETNKEKKNRIKEKIVERELYEMNDLTKKEGVKAEILDKYLGKLDQKLKGLQPKDSRPKEFDKIQQEFELRIDKGLENKIEQGEINPEKAKGIQERIKNRAETLSEFEYDNFGRVIKKSKIKIPSKSPEVSKEVIDTSKKDKADQTIEAIKKRVLKNAGNKKDSTSESLPSIQKEPVQKIDETNEERSIRIQKRIEENRKLRGQKKPSDVIKRNAPFYHGPSNT